MSMLDGSHLFPMEKPVATAAAIEAVLLSLPPRTRSDIGGALLQCSI